MILHLMNPSPIFTLPLAYKGHGYTGKALFSSRHIFVHDQFESWKLNLMIFQIILKFVLSEATVEKFVDVIFVETTPFIEEYFVIPGDHSYNWKGILYRKN